MTSTLLFLALTFALVTSQSTYVLITTKFASTTGVCTGTATQSILSGIKSPFCSSTATILSSPTATGSYQGSVVGGSRPPILFLHSFASDSCTGKASTILSINTGACLSMPDGLGGVVDVVFAWGEEQSFVLSASTFGTTAGTCSGAPTTTSSVSFTNGNCIPLSSIYGAGQVGSAQVVIAGNVIWNNLFPTSATCTGSLVKVDPANTGNCAPADVVSFDTAVSWKASSQAYSLITTKFSSTTGVCTGTATQASILNNLKNPDCVSLASLLANGAAQGALQVDFLRGSISAARFTSNTCASSATTPSTINIGACTTIPDGLGGNVDVTFTWGVQQSFLVSASKFTSTTGVCTGTISTSSSLVTNGDCVPLATLYGAGQAGSAQAVVSDNRYWVNVFLAGTTCSGTPVPFSPTSGFCLSPVILPNDAAIPSWKAVSTSPTFVLFTTTFSSNNGACTSAVSQTSVILGIKSVDCLALASLFADGAAQGSAQFAFSESQLSTSMLGWTSSSTCTGASTNVATQVSVGACTTMSNGLGGSIDVRLKWGEERLFLLTGSKFTSTR